VLSAIRGHHERIDGGGYPDGLAGQDIPLFARLLGVADCFDALTSVRPYRAPLSMFRAIDVLQEVAGTQLDSHLVRTFVRLLADRPGLAQARSPLAPCLL
jgi:HD-GYP domain-containing protein (c-di-GMP phosphodiesterase class II)